MNILVTGANGQLGNEIRIISKDTADRFVFTDVSQVEGLETAFLDITDLAAVRGMVSREKIDVIINCAAYTNVDAAETGGLLVHVSTDYVFGREPYNTPCREDQKGTPTGVYGLTKLHGEQHIIASGCRHVIIRTAWLYSEFGRNFCKTMLHLTATKPELNVVFDQCGTPTYAYDLAGAIITIVGRWSSDDASFPYGVYHYSNEGVCSWYDFTKMIAEYAGRTSCNIRPCHSDEFPSPVTRPAYSVLDKTKIKETFGIGIPYWTESLRRCIENMN